MKPVIVEVLHGLLSPGLVLIYWLLLALAAWVALRWVEQRFYKPCRKALPR